MVKFTEQLAIAARKMALLVNKESDKYGVKIFVSEGKAEVSFYNGTEIFFSNFIAEGEDLEVYVPHTSLPVIEKMAVGGLSASEKDGKLILENGKAKVSIPTLKECIKPVQFDILSGAEKTAYNVNTASLKDALADTAQFCGENFKAIFVSGREGELIFSALSNALFARTTMSATAKGEANKEFSFIPGVLVKALGLTTCEAVSFYVTDKVCGILARTESAMEVWQLPLAIGKLPAVYDALKKVARVDGKVNLEELKEILGLISVTSTKEKILRVSADSEDEVSIVGCDIESSVQATLSGGFEQIGLAAPLVSQVLSLIKEDDVLIAFGGPTSAIKVERGNSEWFVLPVKIK